MFAALKQMEETTGISARSIKFEDIDIFSFFMDDDFKGLPFDAELVRRIADTVFPTRFSDVVRILGFAHGKNVWIGNGENLAGTVCVPEAAIAHRDVGMENVPPADYIIDELWEIPDIIRKVNGEE